MKVLSKIILFIKSIFTKDIYGARKKLVAYICGTEVLPEPMTCDEEMEYLIKASKGDESAKATLIERNLRLVIYIAKKFENSGVELEDLVSIGSIGLIKAVSTFNYEKNIKLATYASRCIENEIRMTVRSGKKNMGEVLLQDPIGKDKDGKNVTLIDKLSNDDESIFDSVNLKLRIRELYREMKRVLEEREKKVLELPQDLLSLIEFLAGE